MKGIIVLIAMIFLHVFADYGMQGILASMKQREWWNLGEGKSKYRNDYKAALIAHSFEWAFVVMLPCTIELWKTMNHRHFILYLILFVDMCIWHYIVDDGKANVKDLNLIQDQLLHIVQILITWLCWTLASGWWCML